MPRHRDGRRGQSLVEFALVMPVLLIILLGIFDFARAWSAHQTITAAAREGARRAVIFDPTIDSVSVRKRVQEVISSAGYNPNAPYTTVTINGWRGGVGKATEVYVTYNYQFTFLRPFIKLFNVSSQGVLKLKTAMRMRNE